MGGWRLRRREPHEIFHHRRAVFRIIQPLAIFTPYEIVEAGNMIGHLANGHDMIQFCFILRQVVRERRIEIDQPSLVENQESGDDCHDFCRACAVDDRIQRHGRVLRKRRMACAIGEQLTFGAACQNGFAENDAVADVVRHDFFNECLVHFCGSTKTTRSM